MSSEASDSSTSTPAQQPESSTTNPTLTVVTTGPATFTRRVSSDDEASILAEHDTVELTIERELQSADEFETVIDPIFKGNGPTASKTVLIDRPDQRAYDGGLPARREQRRLVAGDYGDGR